MQSMARILFATYSLAFQNPGGGERVLLALRAELVKRGHEVDIFDPFLHDVRNYDLLHFFSALESTFWEHAKSRNPKAPLVVTPTLNPFGPRTAQKWNERERRFSLPDLWLPTTIPEATFLADKYRIPRAKIRVVPNGVTDLFIAPATSSDIFRKRFFVEGPFVLNVGRFHPVKNQLALIDACARAKAKLVLIGNADLNEHRYFEICMTRMSQAGGTVIHIPALAQDDPLLASAYAAARVFALPSEFETFGIAALEAAVSGCRLVLTDQMAARDLFEPLARWVAPTDHAGLTDAITQALGDANPDPDSHRARRQWLRDHLTWEKVGEQLMTSYGAVLDSPPRPHPHSPSA